MCGMMNNVGSRNGACGNMSVATNEHEMTTTVPLGWRHYAVRSMHKLNDVKRSQFWCGHIDSQRGKPREMWRSVNRLLGRQPSPTSGVGVIDADTMASSFRDKVDETRVSAADADEPTYTINSSDCSFMGFESVNVQAVIKLIRDAPPKTSPIDPLPMWLLKVCADEVAPFISKLFNQSLCVV